MFLSSVLLSPLPLSDLEVLDLINLIGLPLRNISLPQDRISRAQVEPHCTEDYPKKQTFRVAVLLHQQTHLTHLIPSFYAKACLQYNHIVEIKFGQLLLRHLDFWYNCRLDYPFISERPACKFPELERKYD